MATLVQTLRVCPAANVASNPARSAAKRATCPRLGSSRTTRGDAAVTASSSSDADAPGVEIEHCSGCLKPDSCPCPKALRRAKSKSKRAGDLNSPGPRGGDGSPSNDEVTRRDVLTASFAAFGVVSLGSAPSAKAMSNGAVSDAWAKISGAPSDLTFPEEFAGTWLVYSSLTRVDTPQGEGMVQDMAVVDRARKDVGGQIIYPMRFIKNDQGRVVMDRAYNVVKMAEATARAYNVMDAVEWDVNDPNVLKAALGDGRSVFFRVNQRSEEYPAADRIETSEVAQVVFDGGDNGGYAAVPADKPEQVDDFAGAATSMVEGGVTPVVGSRANQPKVKSSRTYTKWKFRPVESAGDGPAIVASQVVYDYLTSFDAGFIESKGEPVTQYTYKLALFKANQTNLEN